MLCCKDFKLQFFVIGFTFVYFTYFLTYFNVKEGVLKLMVFGFGMCSYSCIMA